VSPVPRAVACLRGRANGRRAGFRKPMILSIKSRRAGWGHDAMTEDGALTRLYARLPWFAKNLFDFARAFSPKKQHRPPRVCQHV
jgi:hypothetical protein